MDGKYECKSRWSRGHMRARAHETSFCARATHYIGWDQLLNEGELADDALTIMCMLPDATTLAAGALSVLNDAVSISRSRPYLHSLPEL